MSPISLVLIVDALILLLRQHLLVCNKKKIVEINVMDNAIESHHFTEYAGYQSVTAH